MREPSVLLFLVLLIGSNGEIVENKKQVTVEDNIDQVAQGSVDVGLNHDYYLGDKSSYDIYERTDDYKDDDEGTGYRKRYDEPFDDRTTNKLDKFYGFTGPTANDEPDNLIRPCALEDWQCIRKYFAANSQCTPAHGPIPDPFYIEKNTLLSAVANTTVTLLGASVRGLSSAKVNDFYVNRKTGNLVFAIDVQNLNLTIPRAYVRYKRAARESLVLADRAFALFRTATLTAILSKVPKLRLGDADLHIYSRDIVPVLVYGPGIYDSPDPVVVAANARFVGLASVGAREVLASLGPLITGMYIQQNICDFGLKLISL